MTQHVMSQKLEQACQLLARQANARVHLVMQCSPTVIVVLAVPRGTENLPVVNPIGASSCGISGTPAGQRRFHAPTLLTIDEERLEAEPQSPELRDVPGQPPPGRITIADECLPERMTEQKPSANARPWFMWWRTK